MIAIATIALLALLNRARGDDRWMPAWLPGRALWYVAPLVGLLAWAVHPWPVAAAWTLTYLVWALPGWGHLYGLGRYTPDREVDRLTAALLKVSGGDVHFAFFLRHLFLAIPIPLLSLTSGAEWLPWVATVAAWLFVGAYEASWRWAPRHPILVAELIVGALWGAGIVAL